MKQRSNLLLTQAQTFSKVLPGSISEMMPDYGCPVQAWTIYGLAVPLVTHVLGIKPDAYHKSVVITPHLPGDWNHAAIYDLPIGNNAISFAVERRGYHAVYSITSAAPGWKYSLKIKGLTGHKYKINGKEFIAMGDEIDLVGTVNRIELL